MWENLLGRARREARAGFLSPHSLGTLRRWAWWELVGLRAMGWGWPGRPLFPELPREANGCSRNTFPVLSASGLELSTSQEYRSSTSTTAVMPSERVLPKPQTDPRKIRKILGLSRGSRVSQVSEHQKQSMLETTPAHGVRHNSNKPEATQGPKPKPRKTEAAQEPTQTSSATDVTEGSKPGKTRATLSPKERLRRARAVRAQSWKLKAQSNWASSQSQARKSQDKPIGSIPGEENSSHSESPETNSSKADSILDLSLRNHPVLTFMLPDK